MKPSEIKRFTKYYDRHVKLFKLQGKSQKAIIKRQPLFSIRGLWNASSGKHEK